MTKKQVVKGFRTAYIDEEVDEKKQDESQEKTPSIEEQLVEIICERYAPAETIQESDEQKSTLQLIEEMESFSEVFKSNVVLALKEKGFKPYYTGESFVWLLRER